MRPACEYVPVDGELELLPGVRLVPAPGHTPGTQVVVVETGGRPVVIGGDMAVWFGELDEPQTEGQLLVRALDPELVWLSHDARAVATARPADDRHTGPRDKQSPRRTSMAVRVDLNISLDGFATTTDQTPENPFGPDWARLTEAYAATRTFRARVLQETSGEGTTGVDDEYAQAYFAEVGAEIMGAGMFGLHDVADDPDWRGWWGDEPPFHVPVFVLTHTPRPTLEMAGGTTFHFLAATPREALDLALEAAGGKDVRIGGGPTVVREFLKAGLVDRLHVAIVPILLGRGIRLWDDLRGLEDGYSVTSEVAPSGITHLTFAR